MLVMRDAHGPAEDRPPGSGVDSSDALNLVARNAAAMRDIAPIERFQMRDNGWPVVGVIRKELMVQGRLIPLSLWEREEDGIKLKERLGDAAEQRDVAADVRLHIFICDLRAK